MLVEVAAKNYPPHDIPRVSLTLLTNMLVNREIQVTSPVVWCSMRFVCVGTLEYWDRPRFSTVTSRRRWFWQERGRCRDVL